MAQYTYKAKNSKGVSITGIFDAKDKQAVVSMLRMKGIYPIQINEVNINKRKFNIRRNKKISYKDLMVFCKQFHTMLNAGLTVIGCMDLLRKQTENKTLADVVNNVYSDLQKGLGLTEALKIHSKVLPIMMTSMIEVGELSGNIDTALERLVVHFTKENKIKQKILTAMMYPLIIGLIAGTMILFMLMFIVPKFIGIFGTMGMELPFPTRILQAVSTYMRGYVFWILLPLVIGAGRYVYLKLKDSVLLKNTVIKIIIKIPIIGSTYKKVLASRFSRSLSILLKTGVPLIQSLEVVDRVVDNVIVSKGIVNVKEEVKRGSNLAAPLEEIGIFPVMVIQMISVGEESGSLDNIVETVADYYDDEIDVAISKVVAMLEPLMIFILAIMIGAIVISMIYPIFSMYKGMGAN